MVVYPPEADKTCLEYRRICIPDAIYSPVSEMQTNYLHNIHYNCNYNEIINTYHLYLQFTHTLSVFLVAKPPSNDHFRGTIWMLVEPHLGQLTKSLSLGDLK